jgi:hypothetical protein
VQALAAHPGVRDGDGAFSASIEPPNGTMRCAWTAQVHPGSLGLTCAETFYHGAGSDGETAFRYYLEVD